MAVSSIWVLHWEETESSAMGTITPNVENESGNTPVYFYVVGESSLGTSIHMSLQRVHTLDQHDGIYSESDLRTLRGGGNEHMFPTMGIPLLKANEMSKSPSKLVAKIFRAIEADLGQSLVVDQEIAMEVTESVRTGIENAYERIISAIIGLSREAGKGLTDYMEAIVNDRNRETVGDFFDTGEFSLIRKNVFSLSNKIKYISAENPDFSSEFSAVASTLYSLMDNVKNMNDKNYDDNISVIDVNRLLSPIKVLLKDIADKLKTRF